MMRFLAGVAFMGGWFYFEMVDYPRTAASMAMCAILILLSNRQRKRRPRDLWRPGSDAAAVAGFPRGGFTPRSKVTVVESMVPQVRRAG